MITLRGILGPAVLCSTFLCIYNAYKINGQFFTTSIYLMKSNFNMMVLVACALYLIYAIANVTIGLFFGSLRLVEVEHLHEYGWLTISESFLAMTIFRNEFDAKFILFISLLLGVKALHWITRDRIDLMEQAPQLPPSFILRILAVIVFLSASDVLGLYLCVKDVLSNGPSMSILFGNEFALLLVSMLTVMVRFTLNHYDIVRGGTWEYRSIFLFYYEFLADLLKLVVYSIFFGVIVKFYGIPLHIIRDLYVTFRSFIIRIKDIIRYRRATANMNERYPDATETELAETDRICIICREEMFSAKRLSCGHLFHFRCLRSWLERQQTCPTCRRSIFESEEAPTPLAANVEEELPRRDLAEGDPTNHPVGQYPAHQQASTASSDNTHEVEIVPEIHGEVITGPFVDAPVVIVPPDQLAPFQEGGSIGAAKNIATSGSLTDIPLEGRYSVPTSSSAYADGGQKSLYVLRSNDSQSNSVLLEAVGPTSGFSRSSSIPALVPSSEDILQLTLLERNARNMRNGLHDRLKIELETLSQLQLEVSRLTEHLLEAQSRLEQIDGDHREIGADPAGIEGSENHSEKDL